MAERLLTDEDVTRRMPLWCALAELFLDTEIQASGYHAIARAARDGGFLAEEVRYILEQEVFPALIFNLMNIAGEWAAFHPDDVRERILGVLGLPGGYPPRPRLWTSGIRASFLAREWPKVQAALDGREPTIPENSDPISKPNWLAPVIGICFALLIIGSGLILAGR